MQPITHARVMRVAVPIVLANVTVPLLGAVDTAVVGQMGLPAPIGAVGIGAIILASVYWIFGFLRMGTTGLTAQAVGANNPAEVTAILLRALLIGAAAGVFFILVQIPLFAGALWLSPGSEAVETLAQSYLHIRIWGAPATIALYAVTGWLIATERTRAVLILQLWINGVNITLDLWFVLGLGWGVQGVAIATLIAEWTGLAYGLWLCRSAFGAALAPGLARLRDAAALRHMAVVNGDIMIRSILLQISFTSFLFLGAGQGDVTLAANQVLMQFLTIAAFFLDGFAFAAEALVGQAVGARSVTATRRASIVSTQWGAGAVACLSLVYLAAGPALIDLMTTAPQVRLMAREFLPWLVAAPIIGVWAWMLDGIFIGATLARVMRQTMLLSVIAYGIALLVLVPLWGNHGLWAALMVLNITRGISMGLKWQLVEGKARGA
ncbi:multidrug resistance protein, MATE family [Pseudorhodobacter antarcticus]|uniref:Multidrug resistance protein, MATE family n=1 Tax=Pseudorhodobacter antarcticus TaxID=1077947 RepID=A0A1H8FBR3_9RHOB|nr:MATE family efflux transporter [Pseudorhodobacter antarcticus]SEN29192.1 multidrug resistance protein, MATE family [Pseudorhodobacter antarcticus]